MNISKLPIIDQLRIKKFTFDVQTKLTELQTLFGDNFEIMMMAICIRDINGSYLATPKGYTPDQLCEAIRHLHTPESDVTEQVFPRNPEQVFPRNPELN